MDEVFARDIGGIPVSSTKGIISGLVSGGEVWILKGGR
jgi:hypothetical protein